MDDLNEELTPKEKLDQENFVLKSKIITKGGIFSEDSDIDPEIENIFLKNIMAFEEAEYQPVHEIIGVNPEDYPPAESLSETEIKTKLRELIDILERHQMYYEINENVPEKLSYQYLTQDYLFSETQQIEGYETFVDGCSGDCPSCFQIDYCENKNDIWSPGELEEEIKRRKDMESNPN